MHQPHSQALSEESVRTRLFLSLMLFTVGSKLTIHDLKFVKFIIITSI